MSYIGNTQQNQNYFPAVDFFSGNGSTTAFTLSRQVASTAAIQVIVSNVAQNPSSAYTVNGNTITFTSAPPSGTNNIYVYYTSPNTTVVQPSQGTVGLLQLSATGSPDSTKYLRGDNTWNKVDSFVSGTTMLFVQSTAPTGWTKSTSHNDKALRIVSGTAGTGGSVDFSSAFSTQAISGSVGNTTLSTDQMPSHVHQVFMTSFAGTLGIAMQGGGDGSWYGVPDAPEAAHHYGTPAGGDSSMWAYYSGGSGAHNHSFSGTSLNLSVKYVDAIIAVKD